MASPGWKPAAWKGYFGGRCRPARKCVSDGLCQVIQSDILDQIADRSRGQQALDQSLIFDAGHGNDLDLQAVKRSPREEVSVSTSVQARNAEPFTCVASGVSSMKVKFGLRSFFA